MSTPSTAEEADLKAMAAMDFEALKDLPATWCPPTNREWMDLANPHLISVRLAWVILHRSKEELIVIAEQLGEDPLVELVEQIGRSSDWFEELHNLLACAESRMMCSRAALHSSREEGAQNVGR